MDDNAKMKLRTAINPYAIFMIVAFLVTAQAILLLSHWFVFRTIAYFLGPLPPAWLLALRWAFMFLSAGFLAASLLAFRYYNPLTRIFYALTAGWLGIFYFLLLACLLVWLAYLLPINHKAAASALLVLGLFAGIYSLVNASSPRIKTLDVALPNLPADLKGKTAVWVSDTHLGQLRNAGFAQKIAKQIKALKPDLVFFGGDLFDGAAADADQAIKSFADLQAPLGIYFITGNHEQFGDDAKYAQAARRAGMRVLDNELVDLGGLQVIGLDYRDSRTAGSERDILQGLKLDPGRPSILLKHEPNNVDVAEQAGISLQISGHTHGGAQAWPLGFIPKKIYGQYHTGLHTLGQTIIYTSTGAGTWGPPIRFFSTPEIVQIRFK